MEFPHTLNLFGTLTSPFFYTDREDVRRLPPVGERNIVFPQAMPFTSMLVSWSLQRTCHLTTGGIRSPRASSFASAVPQCRLAGSPVEGGFATWVAQSETS